MFDCMYLITKEDLAVLKKRGKRTQTPQARASFTAASSSSRVPPAAAVPSFPPVHMDVTLPTSSGSQDWSRDPLGITRRTSSSSSHSSALAPPPLQSTPTRQGPIQRDFGLSEILEEGEDDPADFFAPSDEEEAVIDPPPPPPAVRPVIGAVPPPLPTPVAPPPPPPPPPPLPPLRRRAPLKGPPARAVVTPPQVTVHRQRRRQAAPRRAAVLPSPVDVLPPPPPPPPPPPSSRRPRSRRMVTPRERARNDRVLKALIDSRVAQLEGRDSATTASSLKALNKVLAGETRSSLPVRRPRTSTQLRRQLQRGPAICPPERTSQRSKREALMRSDMQRLAVQPTPLDYLPPPPEQGPMAQQQQQQQYQLAVCEPAEEVRKRGTKRVYVSPIHPVQEPTAVTQPKLLRLSHGVKRSAHPCWPESREVKRAAHGAHDDVLPDPDQDMG